jgi:hypothetical protein
MSRSIQPRIPRSAWSSCSLTAHPFRTRTPPTYEQPAVNVSPRWDDLSAERAPYVSARDGRPWLRSAPVPDEANRHAAHGAEGEHRRRQRRIMHVLYVGAQGTAVALEDYAKDLRSRLRVDTQRRRRLELRATASPRSRRLRRCFPSRSLRADCRPRRRYWSDT